MLQLPRCTAQDYRPQLSMTKKNPIWVLLIALRLTLGALGTHRQARSTGLDDPVVSGSRSTRPPIKDRPNSSVQATRPLHLHVPARSPLMKFSMLVSVFLLPVVSLAHEPSPLLAHDGRDLSFLLKRYDGPDPILRRAVKGRRHIVPRTLQVEEVPVRRALNGLVERQQCLDPNYVPCTGNTQCCPAGAECGPGICCPEKTLACAGNCKDRCSSLRLSLPLTH